MKKKKLLLSVLIFAVAIVAAVGYLLVSSVALKPTITEGEFPFSITYELDGETVTVDDVYKVQYDRKEKIYTGVCLSTGKDDTTIVLKQDENTRVELCTSFYPDYLMGDSEYDYFSDASFEPTIYYYDAYEIEYDDEETLAAQGVKLIGYEYPTPIENTFVFSHFSHFTSAAVIPTLLIALLALVAILIFVRKGKEVKYRVVDIISIVLNFVIGSGYLAFVTIAAVLIDINGGGPELYYQIMYFIPAFSVLCLAASIALRRTGYGKSSLIAQLIGPAIFVLYFLICYVGGLF